MVAWQQRCYTFEVLFASALEFAVIACFTLSVVLNILV